MIKEKNFCVITRHTHLSKKESSIVGIVPDMTITHEHHIYKNNIIQSKIAMCLHA